MTDHTGRLLLGTMWLLFSALPASAVYDLDGVDLVASVVIGVVSVPALMFGAYLLGTVGYLMGNKLFGLGEGAADD